MTEVDPEQDGLVLHASYERQIITLLSQSGWIDARHAPLSLYLRAYCVYWMSEMQLFSDKTPEEIEAIFDAYTERGFEDLPTELFFSMMGDISHEQPEEYVEIGSTLVGNTLVLHPPTDMPLPFTVLGNEIMVGNYRIGLQWLGMQKKITG